MLICYCNAIRKQTQNGSTNHYKSCPKTSIFVGHVLDQLQKHFGAHFGARKALTRKNTNGTIFGTFSFLLNEVRE